MSQVYTVRGLSKSYPTKNGPLQALSNIDLNVEERDIYGIIGLSGAGKSTLIRCLNLLEVPQEGIIEFDGEPLFNSFETPQVQKGYKKRLNANRQKMGMIFQSFNLFDQMTVYKNILYPLSISKTTRENYFKSVGAITKEQQKEALKNKVDSLLEIVGLTDKAKAYPSQLSGGQQQRVAIARALANDPKVLLCDEPTSALDPQTTNQILDLLKDINHKLGVTIIIITHEMRIVDAICNKVSIIDHSSIAESGYVKDVFQNPKSSIAKQLILPGAENLFKEIGNRYLRIVYDDTVYEPILSKLIIECKCEISILASDVRCYEGKNTGHMIVQVPEDQKVVNQIISFLKGKNVQVEEVNGNDYTNTSVL